MLRASSQNSPFRYGKSNDIYFMDTAERRTLGITDIYTVSRYKSEHTGGMWENWDLSILEFGVEEVKDSWSPLNLPEDFQYSLDTVLNLFEFLNGSVYSFDNNKLIGYGGQGYGSFDWFDLETRTDSTSIFTKFCVGHCGDQCQTYSKNVFDKNGLLRYTVNYPCEVSQTDKFNEEYVTPRMLDECLKIMGMPATDTVFVRYNDRGLFIDDGMDEVVPDQLSAEETFALNDSNEEYAFYQIYVDHTPMEEFIQKKLGMKPKAIVMEIYMYGVLSFVLNDQQKYERGREVMLEQ